MLKIFKHYHTVADVGEPIGQTRQFETALNLWIISLSSRPNYKVSFPLKITLMRHGKPLLPATKWLAPFEMERWIEHYNRSEVESVGIPASSVKAASAASVIVASTAPRALSSVRALHHDDFEADAVFCEAQLPFALWRFPYLPPHVLAAFFRLLWLFGYSRGADSVQATKIRAKVATERLISLARKGPVLLVGHGIMNRLIAKELRALGWVDHAKHESKYWSTSVYSQQIQN